MIAGGAPSDRCAGHRRSGRHPGAHLLAGMQYVLGDLEADDTPTAPLKK